MKLVSWNVNGARAVHRKGEWHNFLKVCGGADIISIQELKTADPTVLPPDMQHPDSQFVYFNCAKEKKGYSGVGLYCKEEPDRVEDDFGFSDIEGRYLGAYFESKKLYVAGLYFPNGGGLPERMEYKLDFYDAFLEHLDSVKQRGYSVFFMGDVNAAHTPMDLTHPDSNEGTPGYNPDVREWIDEVERHGFIDTFRHLYPNKVKYSYWDLKTRARDRNVGWRIDYVFASQNLLPKLREAFILNDIYGSDHCPVGVEIDV